ncbi:unnamed protein product [Cuscuta campestris]|uniref:Uncharacterized protein n=1 Tax=Cuscuta campestris TaxID=132261 RepID=A0A484KQG7_9ASTE|nr:unnamed protein product [Cuscuta campestris]
MSLSSGVVRAQGIERAFIIATLNHNSRPRILHRKTVRVKFYSAIIVTGKLTNGNKVMDDMRGNKYIVKGKWWGGRVATSTVTAVRPSTTSTIAVPASAVALGLSAKKLSAVVLTAAAATLLTAAWVLITAALLPESAMCTSADGGQGSPIVTCSCGQSALSFEEEKSRSIFHECGRRFLKLQERSLRGEILGEPTESLKNKLILCDQGIHVIESISNIT